MKRTPSPTRTDPLQLHGARRGQLPRYAQCASLLRHRIESAHWPVGARIPSLEALAAECSVAVVTIRQAVALLEDEGLVERRQGVGTFVVGRAAQRNWLALGTSWDSLLESLADVTVHLVRTETRPAMPALQPGEGRPADRYRFQKRVHCRGNDPFCVVRLHLAHDLYALDPRRFDTELALRTMTRVAPGAIDRAWQTMTIASADPETAAELGIAVGDPVAQVHRVINDAQERAIYVADITYRADVIRLEVDLVGRRAYRGTNKGSPAP
jgi:GntR family transcriptional regulator